MTPPAYTNNLTGSRETPTTLADPETPDAAVSRSAAATTPAPGASPAPAPTPAAAQSSSPVWVDVPAPQLRCQRAQPDIGPARRSLRARATPSIDDTRSGAPWLSRSHRRRHRPGSLHVAPTASCSGVAFVLSTPIHRCSRDTAATSNTQSPLQQQPAAASRRPTSTGPPPATTQTPTDVQPSPTPQTQGLSRSPIDINHPGWAANTPMSR